MIKNVDLQKVSVMLTDDSTKTGLVGVFDPGSPLALFPSDYQDSSEIPPVFVPPESIVFIGFLHNNENNDLRFDKKKEKLRKCSLDLVNRRQITVLCVPEEVSNTLGFFGYPTEHGGIYEKYWFYHHAILVYEDMEPIGEKLIHEGVLDHKELEEGLVEQDKARHLRIGEILKTKKIIDEKLLEKALKEQKFHNKGKKNIRIGDVLVEAGLATPKDIEAALKEQKKSKNKRLGELLVEKGIVSEEDIMRVLAAKFNLSFVNLNDFEVDPDAIEHLPKDQCLKYQMLPIMSDANSITIAIADPLAFEAIDLLRFFTQKEVRQVLVTPSQMKQYLEPYTKELGVENREETFNQLVESIKDLEQDTETEEDDTFFMPSENDPGVVKVINYIILESVKRGASDIHIEPGGKHNDVKVRIRIDGKCETMWKLPATARAQIASRIKIMCDMDISEKRKPQDGKIKLSNGKNKIELRVATLPVVGGDEDVVLRVLPGGKPLPVEKLGLSPWNYKKITRIIEKPYGIVLVVGPTGSGKTTTLHSLLSSLNTDDRKIWTAEDPVEITQPGLRQVQMNPKAGLVFTTALRAFLRADPDIIMIGEMRDIETIRIAIQASLTGHMVFSTLHTNSSPETISRLLDMGVDPFTFSDALQGVLAQRLVRRLCNDCKIKVEAGPKERAYLVNTVGREEVERHLKDGNLYLYKAKGCSKCRNTGYKGRMGIHEFLVVDEEIRKAIQQKKSVDDIRAIAIKTGLKTLLQDGLIKVFQGYTDLHEVQAVTGGIIQ